MMDYAKDDAPPPATSSNDKCGDDHAAMQNVAAAPGNGVGNEGRSGGNSASSDERERPAHRPTASQRRDEAAEGAGGEADEGDDSPSSSGSDDDESSDSEGGSESGESDDGDSSETSESDDGENDDGEEDDGLSDYERLRLRNIRRNEARLARLGLLSGTAPSSIFAADDGSVAGGASRGSAPEFAGGKKRKRTKEKVAVGKRRSLPPRRSKLERRRDVDDPSDSSGSSSLLQKRRKRSKSLGPSRESSFGEDGRDGRYDSDESSAASPVKIARTLRPQPHQAALDEHHLKHYKRTRRSRRGRPKREEYLYGCDERCARCDGEWKFDSEEEEERTRLIRCKDCGGAFHLSCMLVHGAEDDEEATEDAKAATVVSSGSSENSKASDESSAADSKEEYKSEEEALTTKLEVDSSLEADGKPYADASESADEHPKEEDLAGREIMAAPSNCNGGGAEKDEMGDDGDGKAAAEAGIFQQEEDGKSAAADSECANEDPKEKGKEDGKATGASSDFEEGGTKREVEKDEGGKAASEADPFGGGRSTRDPKRCRRCESKRKAGQEQEQSSPGVQEKQEQYASTVSLPLLEATIGGRTVRVRVVPEPESETNVHEQQQTPSIRFLPLLEATVRGRTVQVRVIPELALEANINGKNIMCYVTFHGTTNGSDGKSPTRHVTWGSPLEDLAKEDPATKKLRRLIDRALSEGDNARLQDHSCAALRKRILAEDDDESTLAAVTAKAVRLGGIRMLANAMLRHPGRPSTQAEALCTLAEIVWICPRLGVGTTTASRDGDDEGSGCCLELAVAAMERHAVHPRVQRMGCGYFRASSYDAACCARMEEAGAVSTAADSIRRNPRKANVMIEGSMFLQNMMVASPAATTKVILRSGRGIKDGLPDLPSTLLAAVRADPSNVDLVSPVLDLLSRVALRPRGGAVLRRLDAGTSAADAVRDHPDAPGLHSAAFALLRNAMNLEDDGRRTSEAVRSVLRSMENYPEEETLQINGCELLSSLASGGSSLCASAQSLIRSGSGATILTLAGDNFPEGCRDFVDGLLAP